jgi:hypothetical protein
VLLALLNNGAVGDAGELLESNHHQFLESGNGSQLRVFGTLGGVGLIQAGGSKDFRIEIKEPSS